MERGDVLLLMIAIIGMFIAGFFLGKANGINYLVNNPVHYNCLVKGGVWKTDTCYFSDKEDKK